MTTSSPILSIITICYNDLAGLKKTVESVLSQNLAKLEYIVIDGGSTDGTKEYLDIQKQCFSYYCSEKDKGIYDAQNKGIVRANGAYLLFLNAGDTFYNDTVVDTFVNFASESSAGIIYGDTNLINDKGEELLIQPDNLSNDFWYLKTLNHQASFIKRDLFQQLGLYNLDYRICADFDFFVKAYKYNPKMFFHLHEVICNYDQFGFSSSKENFAKMMEEHQQILKLNFTKQEYAAMQRNHRMSLTPRKRLVRLIHENTLLNKIFGPVLTTYSKLRSSGK